MKTFMVRQLIIAMLLLSVFGAGCNEPTLTSNWRSAPPASANSDSTWANSTQYTINDNPVIIGFQNDANDLYVYLRAVDRDTQMKIMRGGMTLWLDAKGEKNKKFGIKYPVGMRWPQGAPFERGGQPMGDFSEMRGRFSATMDSIEVIGPGENKRVRIPVNNELGLTVVHSDTAGPASFEFIVPLKKSDETPYAISAENGKIFSIGFEAGMNMEMKPEGQGEPRERSGGRGGAPGGGMGSGGGGPEGGGGFGGRGGMGGRPRGGGGMRSGESNNESSSEPIKFWVKIKLAGDSEAK